MNNINWDLLQPEDIEVRVGNKIKGTENVNMLLYQDSRCTARNLDKQFGQFGWQIDYKVVGEQIYGTLSIYDETKQQWISKSDTGDKSNISEDKGQSSDILKRCAVRWGFGTELYTSPKIVIPDDGYGNSGYKVSEINYNQNREIIHLVIVNRFGKEAFRWDMNQTQQNPPIKNPYKENPRKPDNLEWTPEEENNVVQVQMTKQLSPAEELKQWYDITEHNPITDKFFNYWYKRLSENQWKGKFSLQDLVVKYCK